MAKVTGLAELSAALKSVPDIVAVRVAYSGTRAVANEVAKRARKNALAHGGGLARMAKAITTRKATRGQIRAQVAGGIIVGWRKPWSRLAHLFEFGTAERVQKETGRRTGRMAPQPHLRPAIAEVAATVFEAVFVRGAARRLERELKKLAKK